MGDPQPKPLTFDCEGERLVGILDFAPSESPISVVIVVGGPQYRVGSHRQFTLLARDLARAGFSTLRFDHRGTGDSAGQSSFEDMEPDIRAAIDTCLAENPSANQVVLWGICDAASAIMMYAPSDPRVRGIVVLNPWVRDDQTRAKVVLSEYYVNRLVNREFWGKLLTGRIGVLRSIREFAGNLRQARGNRSQDDRGANSGPGFQDRMMSGLSAFDGKTLVVLSGNDLTASEFRVFVSDRRQWRGLLERSNVRVIELAEADHTFSSHEWRSKVSDWTTDWLRNL